MVAGTHPALKAGAALFALWSVLHIWVPLEGYRVYLADGNAGAARMLTGGAAVPHGAYRLPSDAPTTLAQSRLFLNFVTDVGAVGVLGLFVAHGLWHNRNARLCFALGVVVIGIADLAFLFLMVLSGVIELSLGAVSGPIIWFLAVAVTPFGLPKLGDGRAAKRA